MGVVVIRVDAGRLREPAAWIMLAVVSTGVLIGIARLLVGGSAPFGGSEISFGARAAGGLSLASPLSTAIAVGAVLLVTKFGEPTRRAGAIAWGIAGSLGLAVIFSVISLLGLLIGGAVSFRDKFEYLVTGLPMVALTALGMVFALSSLAPRAPRRKQDHADESFFGNYQDDAHPGYGRQPAQPALVAGPTAYSNPPQAPVEQYAGQAQGPAEQYAGSQGPVEQYAGQAQAPVEQYTGPVQAPVEQQYAAPVYGDAYSQPLNAQPLNAQPVNQPGAQPMSQPSGQPQFQERPYPEPYQESPSGRHYAPLYGAQDYAQEPSAPSGPHAVQPAESSQPQEANPPFGQSTGGYPLPPQGPLFDQHGYAEQQPDALGYGRQPFTGQPEGRTFRQAAPSEAAAFAQPGYADPLAGRSSYADSGARQPYADPAFGYPPADQGQPGQPYGQQQPAAPSGYPDPQPARHAAPQPSSFDTDAQQTRVYDSLIDPREQQLAQAYQQAQGYQQHAQPEPQSYQQPQQPQQPQHQPQGYQPQAEQPEGYQQHLQQPERPQGYPQPEQQPQGYPQPEQQPLGYQQQAERRQGYQQLGQQPEPPQGFQQQPEQVQGFQQHAQQVEQGTGPLFKVPDFYSGPLGHPQTPEPATYADQTLRFDPGAYQGDALSDPTGGKGPIDPTAIYAPERSPVKHEEGVGTEQVGQATDSNLHWYGSDR